MIVCQKGLIVPKKQEKSARRGHATGISPTVTYPMESTSNSLTKALVCGRPNSVQTDPRRGTWAHRGRGRLATRAWTSRLNFVIKIRGSDPGRNTGRISLKTEGIPVSYELGKESRRPLVRKCPVSEADESHVPKRVYQVNRSRVR